ncbi:MAG TPA: ATP-dependent Clp protease proteolytic subunit [Ignavibacteria bacterium]|nr:ATP-dependent Clp protease proteolytic subunit [Ignavibacteria bacterium]
MLREISLSNLTSQKTEVIRAIDELNSSNDTENTLNIKLQSTSGSIPEALEVIEKIHTSKVDLATESSGEISPAGLLIAAAGKPKNRKAHFSTIFKLSDNTEEGKKGKSKDPYATCLIETLGGLRARKSELIEIMNTQKFITAIDAKRLKILDDSGLVKNKYQPEKKKSTENEVELAN